MNTSLQHPAPLQKFLHYGLQALKCVINVVLGTFLVLAWVMASPLLRLAIYLADSRRTRLNSKNRGAL